MITAAIYGNNEKSALLKRILEAYYNPKAEAVGLEPIRVTAYIHPEESGAYEGLPVISARECEILYGAGELGIVILPKDNFLGIHSIPLVLTHSGRELSDVYLCERLSELHPEEIDEALTPFPEADYLPYLEFHVTDQCNLNCSACEHYSGLVHEPHFPEFDDFGKDMGQLKRLIGDIGVIRILGGEPLMNPEVYRYIACAREYYPKAQISVVTNALLLCSMPESFYRTMRDCDAQVNISLYPPLEGKMPEILDRMKAEHIPVITTPVIRTFTKKQVLVRRETSGEADSYFYHCQQAGCNNLYRGRLGACFLPFMTHYFNEAFPEEIAAANGGPLPTDGGIDLYEENLTTEELKRRLLKPFARCAYCTEPEEVPWHQIKDDHTLGDWVKE